MFRALRPATSAYRAALYKQAVPARPVALTFARMYAGSALSRSSIESRVLDILKGFEKADASKVTPQASFSKDLGLDSLDAVEVVMAIEEEFSIEIPDKDADEIKSVAEAVAYVAQRDDAK